MDSVNLWIIDAHFGMLWRYSFRIMAVVIKSLDLTAILQLVRLVLTCV